MLCHRVQGFSMPITGKHVWRNGTSAMRRLFKVRLDNHRNLVLTWLFLQSYLVSNLLSFGFWKVGKWFFLYSILFYSVWLVGLAVLLLLFLWMEKHRCVTWSKFTVVMLITFPFFWLWGVSLQLERDGLYVFFMMAYPFVMAAYYRIGQSQMAGVAVSMLVLCTVSFFGHADFTRWQQASVNPHPNMEIADIALEHTPNIHVVMFDALINSAFSKEFMNQRSPGADYLSQLDDSLYAGKLGFADGLSTTPSWDALFGLGHIHRTDEYGRSLHFSGMYPSPLAGLLRNNGYLIQTGFANGFFGPQGPHVDRYHLQQSQPAFSDIPICRERLLGLCHNRLEFLFWKINELGYDKVVEDKPWSEQIPDLIEKAETEAKTPVFSGFYLLIPGHTRLRHVTGDAEDLEAFKRHVSDTSPQVLHVMKRLNALRLKFPDSIFIVSGDHGAWLSRTILTSTDENRRFVTLDRYGVALALLNAHNLCPMSRDWVMRQRYLTPSRLLSASLACDANSRKLIEIFSDRKDFITFGESLATPQ